MKIPKIENFGYSLIRAEKATGIIVNNDNSRYQSNGENYYRIFTDLQELKSHVEDEKRLFPNVFDYSIHDAGGNYIETI